jgi:hypothetical protein
MALAALEDRRQMAWGKAQESLSVRVSGVCPELAVACLVRVDAWHRCFGF